MDLGAGRHLRLVGRVTDDRALGRLGAALAAPATWLFRPSHLLARPWSARVVGRHLVPARRRARLSPRARTSKRSGLLSVLSAPVEVRQSGRDLYRRRPGSPLPPALSPRTARIRRLPPRGRAADARPPRHAAPPRR